MIEYQDLVGKKFGEDYEGEKLDCYGLVKILYKRCNIIIPEYDHSQVNCFKSVDVNSVINMFVNDWIQIDEPQFPCVVAIRNDVEYVNHVGFVLNNLHFREPAMRSHWQFLLVIIRVGPAGRQMGEWLIAEKIKYLPQTK